MAPLDLPGLHRLHSDAAARIARRIVTALDALLELVCGTKVQVGVSNGLALAQTRHECADALVHRAGVVLYSAKADGRGRFCFFEPLMEVYIQTRALLENELRQA